MPHQCVHCGEFYPAGNEELLTGCKKCNGHFFFYVKDEQVQKIKDNPIEIPEKDRTKKNEQDIRDLAGIIQKMPPLFSILNQ